ncbi:pyrimidine reductase family protein [Streptacidiphilus monticola]|jgi:riboflavin biosynthesis pyrimidine reductase|uniref:Pyrimidine reductase family protein n=1 Tax=Streptacidiphilus monticola TaxID=2161674 RepID=A0ABW1G4I9_9ACTN
MRVLLPASPDVTDLTSLEGLAAAYAYPGLEPGDSWLRANMVSSLDGSAQAAGLSEGLSSPADKRIFGVLRALSDVIVVGASTARAEGYRPARARKEFAAERAARGQGPAPAIALVSARLDLDFADPLFTEPLAPTIVLTIADAPSEALAEARKVADVVITGEGRVDLARARAELAARGLVRQLTEGGPTLLGQLVAQDLLDELCLSLAPLVTAGTATRIAHAAEEVTERLELVALLEEKGFLFARYARSVVASD